MSILKANTPLEAINADLEKRGMSPIDSRYLQGECCPDRRGRLPNDHPSFANQMEADRVKTGGNESARSSAEYGAELRPS